MEILLGVEKNPTIIFNYFFRYLLPNKQKVVIDPYNDLWAAPLMDFHD